MDCGLPVVLVFWAFCNKVPQILGVGGGLTAAGIHSFPGAEAKSETKVWAWPSSLGGSRGRSFFASSGLWGQAVLWLVAAFLQSLPLCAFGSISRSMFVSLFLRYCCRKQDPSGAQEWILIWHLEMNCPRRHLMTKQEALFVALSPGFNAIGFSSGLSLASCSDSGSFLTACITCWWILAWRILGS